MEKKKNILYLKNLVIIAMLSCLSVGLMLIHVPIPFAPSFLKLDVAEVPALFAGFFMGFIQGITVILIKNISKIIQELFKMTFLLIKFKKMIKEIKCSKN